ADRDPTPVRIEIIGALEVARGSARLTGGDLASRKGRTLLALLAVRRGAVVPVEGIIEALWGDHPPAKARENVSSLVSRLRATLGQVAVETVGEGYRLVVGSSVTVDLGDAEALVEEAEARLAAGGPAVAART